ncbi:TatD family hydrolase [uncultured Phocaeicola sp.]|jgi:TatD DNase family protein|uniref:TatD family hydrolase n=1 Tax=uncultured Phocaeicola sp. TaxID=990718 RepID=UPI0025F54627|nr:TatD family hydrolase [uncultured Phocaeicola sp.]
MTPLTDTHTHLFVEEFDTDRDLAIIRARESGVYRLFMPNIDETTVEAMLATCKAHPACYPMIGLHPTSVDQDWKEKLAAVEKWLRGPETFFGIGEVGIDLYWDRTFRDEQMQAFDLQVQWALEFGLPLSIHARNAYPEVLEVLEPYRKEPALSGVFHCFSGTEEEASRLLAFDRFMLGINGTVTFKKSTLPEVLKKLPLERLVLETDSPYLAPVPQRGKRNESAFLVHVAEKLSDIFGLPLDQIASQTTANALKVFSKAAHSF